MDDYKKEFIKNMEMKTSTKVFLSMILSLGIVMTAVSSYIDYTRTSKTSDYISAEATLVDAEKKGDGQMSEYTLTYEYEVNGTKEIYSYTTDYEMPAAAVPKIGSKKTIKYNPDHLAQVYTEDSTIGVFQIVGAMMTFIPLTLLLSKHYKASVISLGIGMIIIVLGMIKFNLHQAGFMGMLAIAIPSIIAFACLIELITGRHDTDEKI